MAAKQFISQGSEGIIPNISSVHEEWPVPGNIGYYVSQPVSSACTCRSVKSR